MKFNKVIFNNFKSKNLINAVKMDSKDEIKTI